MGDYKYIILKERPSIKERAAEWFHSKWGVPTEAYLECMEGFLNGDTEYGWYLCLDGDKIVAGNVDLLKNEGIMVEMLRKRHLAPVYGEKTPLWSPSYFAATTGSTSTYFMSIPAFLSIQSKRASTYCFINSTSFS